MSGEKVLVIGGGGHAKVVVATLAAAGYQVAAVLDDNPATWGSTVLGVPVLGGVSELKTASGLAVLAIGSNEARRRIAKAYPEVRWLSVVHPQAHVHESVRLGKGTVVFAGAVIQPDAVVGEHVIVNTGATIDHDCLVEDFVHLAPGVHLAGGVALGEGAFMGIGSVAIPRTRVGSWSTVGAGGVVIRPIPERVTAVGVPAVPLPRKE